MAPPRWTWAFRLLSWPRRGPNPKNKIIIFVKSLIRKISLRKIYIKLLLEQELTWNPTLDFMKSSSVGYRKTNKLGLNNFVSCQFSLSHNPRSVQKSFGDLLNKILFNPIINKEIHGVLMCSICLSKNRRKSQIYNR